MARIAGVDIPRDKRDSSITNLYLWCWFTNSSKSFKRMWY